MDLRLVSSLFCIHCYHNNRPKKDPRDQVVENKQVTADDFTDDDESVRLLDEILEKAQIAHDASKVINITMVTTLVL